MDNGLIFPYPCIRAHAESTVLTIQILMDHLRVTGWGCMGPWLVVGKRWGDAGR